MPHDPDLPQIHVQPGESRLLREPGILVTLLGSCVGITFWVSRLGLGALCHPMLPDSRATTRAPADAAGARRYVDFTVRELAAQFDALGATRVETEIKLFGGADVLGVPPHSSRPSIGLLNCESALRVLEAEGYLPCATCVGGTRGQQIFFNTRSGEVLLRRLGKTPSLRNPSRPGVKP